jgi:hypothetical protein
MKIIVRFTNKLDDEIIDDVKSANLNKYGNFLEIVKDNGKIIGLPFYNIDRKSVV